MSSLWQREGRTWPPLLLPFHQPKQDICPSLAWVKKGSLILPEGQVQQEVEANVQTLIIFPTFSALIIFPFKLWKTPFSTSLHRCSLVTTFPMCPSSIKSACVSPYSVACLPRPVCLNANDPQKCSWGKSFPFPPWLIYLNTAWSATELSTMQYGFSFIWELYLILEIRNCAFYVIGSSQSASTIWLMNQLLKYFI